MSEPIFFKTPAEFRAWLEANHETSTEVIVGFYKKASGKPSMTWPEAVDQALCFGWIDGIRRSHGDDAYTNRFTPRREGSNWSAINIKRVGELNESGQMTPAGLKVFEARTDARSAVYSYEQERAAAALDAEQEREFRANARAWEWFRSQPPGYRRTAIHWVVSAKRPETRQRRLATLIEDSAARRRIGPLTRPDRK
jgi:uncharacterized protein YdeI (YjbR/CyaY-like superfamily)